MSLILSSKYNFLSRTIENPPMFNYIFIELMQNPELNIWSRESFAMAQDLVDDYFILCLR